jgi:hypothetical protein
MDSATLALVGSLPQWLTLMVVSVGAWVAYRQFEHHQEVRKTENLLKIVESTIAHNAQVLRKARVPKYNPNA